MNQLGDFIKIKLRERGQSPSDLAKELEKSRGVVSGWINGKTIPRPETLIKIAEFIGVPYKELTVKMNNSELFGQNKTEQKETIETVSFDAGASILKIEAMCGVILSALGDVLAAQQGRTGAVVREELEEVVRMRTDALVHARPKA